MILLGFIIQEYPFWRRSGNKRITTCQAGKEQETKEELDPLIRKGRFLINLSNIEIITKSPDVSYKQLINRRSAEAGLVILGFPGESVRHEGVNLFTGYDDTGRMLFVHSFEEKKIE